MRRIDTFLDLLIKQNGSDLHLISGNPPRIRLYGELFPIKYRDLSHEEISNLIYDIMSEETRKTFEMRHGVDFAYTIPDVARFRVNTFRHLYGIGAVLRLIPNQIKSLEELHLPEILKNLCRAIKGLILVTGPTGSGKSTTLAAMIDFINRDRRGHILTIEDPVEFVHPNKGCLLTQREVGTHTASFATALRSALREDPDAILVGELRDLETMSLAITAAEMGILVLSTLHTNGASATIDRIINVFPASDQARIRIMLSTSLCGIISQQLVRRSDNRGRLAALEILINTSAVANVIREGKNEQIINIVQSNATLGMQSMDSVLRSLVETKRITGEEAYRKAVDKKAFTDLRDSGMPA